MTSVVTWGQQFNNAANILTKLVDPKALTSLGVNKKRKVVCAMLTVILLSCGTELLPPMSKTCWSL